MWKVIFPSAFICLSVFSSATFAESLKDYVELCKKELGFTKLPEMSCEKNGFQFREFPRTPINDYVGYKRIADKVDYVFACRWILGDTVAGAEAIVHNRENGKTCFFSAKLTEREPESASNQTTLTRASSTLISPTASNAADYWDSPEHVDKNVPCVGCHVAGPYIVTAPIAPLMARFGLINDGHDTMGRVPKRYNAIGTTFSKWNNIIKKNIDTNFNCATSCHVLGSNSPQKRRQGFSGFELQASPTENFIQEIQRFNDMPPSDPHSPYRWINLDTPNATGDHENLTKVMNNYPHFYCRNPLDLEAMVVGGDGHVFKAEEAPDKLRTFNLRDGLVCEDSDQNGSKCHNYFTRYKCNGQWTVWKSTDNNLSNKGDYERRSSYKDLCTSPTDIEALTYTSKGSVQFFGPRDRLSTFDKNKGLTCLNADQGTDKKCSNYTIRFICN